jgi:hypothetical protein
LSAGRVGVGRNSDLRPHLLQHFLGAHDLTGPFGEAHQEPHRPPARAEPFSRFREISPKAGRTHQSPTRRTFKVASSIARPTILPGLKPEIRYPTRHFRSIQNFRRSDAPIQPDFNPASGRLGAEPRIIAACSGNDRSTKENRR